MPGRICILRSSNCFSALLPTVRSHIDVFMEDLCIKSFEDSQGTITCLSIRAESEPYSVTKGPVMGKIRIGNSRIRQVGLSIVFFQHPFTNNHTRVKIPINTTSQSLSFSIIRTPDPFGAFATASAGFSYLVHFMLFSERVTYRSLSLLQLIIRSDLEQEGKMNSNKIRRAPVETVKKKPLSLFILLKINKN